MTPREIVSELDRYIVGQKDAKRAVAIALRNRWRRQLVPEDLRDEIAPKNIIMIGPTGVGKTEISRRLAKLAQAPFIKVEASKFTEVGYVGRDVESIIRDLTDLAVNMVKEEEKQKVELRAREVAEERVLDLLVAGQLGRGEATANRSTRQRLQGDAGKTQENAARRQDGRPLRRCRDDPVSDADDRSADAPGHGRNGIQSQRDVFQPDAEEDQEEDGEDSRSSRYPHAGRGQQAGRHGQGHRRSDPPRRAVGNRFLDEIDKIAGRESMNGPDVSRQGVQRDLLPIVEGSTVNTKYGMVKTDHILFIASGAFHTAKPSDLDS